MNQTINNKANVFVNGADLSEQDKKSLLQTTQNVIVVPQQTTGLNTTMFKPQFTKTNDTLVNTKTFNNQLYTPQAVTTQQVSQTTPMIQQTPKQVKIQQTIIDATTGAPLFQNNKLQQSSVVQQKLNDVFLPPPPVIQQTLTTPVNATIESTLKKQTEQQQKLIKIIDELFKYINKLEQEKKDSKSQLQKVNSSIQSSSLSDVSSVLVDLKQVQKIIGKSSLQQVNSYEFQNLDSVKKYNEQRVEFNAQKSSFSPIDKLNKQLQLSELKQLVYLEVIGGVQTKLQSVKTTLSEQIKSYSSVITNVNSKVASMIQKLPQNARAYIQSGQPL